MKRSVERIKRCRFCEKSGLKIFLKLRPMPKPNAFLTSPHEKEPLYPLQICRCTRCGLVQLTHMVNPQEMFSHYLYMSSMSQMMLRHFEDSAAKLVNYNPTKDKPFVIDIGSNDGSFLKAFQRQNVNVLGVDPAKNIVKKAQNEGVPTYNDFFSKKTAEHIKKKYGSADLIVGTNVFAHMDDLGDALKGVNLLLKNNGVLIMEFPYLVDLIENNEFDTIYHEHRYYFLLKPVAWILKQNGFEIFDCERFSIHGGTMRLYVKRISDTQYVVSDKVGSLYKEEVKKKMYVQKTYDDFAKRIYKMRNDLLKVLHTLKSQNKRIIGYGASAKGNVLLNFCGIGPELIDYIVDSTPYKQGLFTPGTHIPVLPEDQLLRDKPDYALLLIWNFKEEVFKKQKSFLARGSKFIIPVPRVEIISR